MKKSHKRWLYIGLTLFLLLAALYYISGRAPGVAKPWVWNRDDNAAAKQNTGLRFTAHAGFTRSNIGTISSSTTAQGANARVDFASVVVRADSDHPLALACAERIAEKLKTIPAIERVVFASRDPIIGREELLPSQTIRVDVDNLNEWFAPNRSISGNVYVAFGTSASWQTVMYGDDTVPPLVHFRNTATHDLRFTHTGISTQSAFYSKIADVIAQRTVKTAVETIDKFSAASSLLPKMPEAFYPAYREASDVPPIPGLASATTLVDGRRFMLPHYSLVQIESNFAGTSSDFLTAIQDSMNEAGWNGKAQQIGERAVRMRLVRGSETFYLYQEQQNRGSRWDFSILNNEKKQPPDDGPPHLFLLERTEKMSNDSVLSAIQMLLDENASPSVLLMFTDRLYGDRETVKELEEQIRERLITWKAGTPAEQLSLVRFFNREEDKEIAKEMLLKAWQVRQLTLNPLPDSDYTKLAKDLGIEEEMKAMPPPTPELCEEYGFIFLTPENCPMEVEFALEEDVRFITVNEEGYLSFIRFTFRLEKDSYHVEGWQRTFGHGYSGVSWSGGGSLNEISYLGIVHDLPRGNGERFTFSVLSEALPVLRVRVEYSKR